MVEVVPTLPPDRVVMQRLLAELAELDPLGMVSDDRYALQARVLASTPEEATKSVLSTWRIAAERLLLDASTVIRAEVMTPEELEHDIEAAMDGGEVPTVTTALHREPIVRPDRVAPQVLAVLAGGDADEVARASGLNPLQLIRWCDLFVEGGRLRLTGTSSSRHQHDHRFFELLADECRRALSAMAPDAAGSPIEGLRECVEDLGEALAASRGELPLEPSAVDVGEVVADVASAVDAVVLVDHGPAPQLVTDAAVFRRAVRHLLRGALRLSPGRPAQVCVGADDAFVTVEVDVRAPSPGRRALRSLFEPFGEAGGGGSGDLGLFPCRALTVALGGQVGVVERDSGLRFWLAIPRPGVAGGRGERIGSSTIECDDVLPGCAVTPAADTVAELLGEIVNQEEEA